MNPDAQQLIDVLHEGGDASYLWTLQGKRSAWWRRGEAPPLPEAGKDVYFGVHPTSATKSEHQRATIADICAVRCLFAEFDAKDFDSKEAAYQHILNLPLQPSIVIDSGGGFHAYWLFRRSFFIQREDDRTFIADLQGRWVQLVGGDKNAKDLARVLRLPGTENRKTCYAPDFPRVHFIKADYGLLYDLATLESVLPVEEKPAPIQTVEDRTPRNSNPVRLEAYALAAFDNEVNKLAGTIEGGRNAQLYSSAASLASLRAAAWVDPAWFTDSDIERALWNAGHDNGMIRDDGEATFKKTLASGLRRGKANPRPEPTTNEVAETEEKRATLFGNRFEATVQMATEEITTRKVDAATAIIEPSGGDRFRQFHDDTMRVLTADGNANTKLVAILVLAHKAEHGDEATIERPAITVAEALGIDQKTASNSLKTLHSGRVIQWHVESLGYDAQGHLIESPSRHRGRINWNKQSVATVLSLPPGPLEFSPTAYDEKQRVKAKTQRDESAENRRKLEEAETKLTQLNCPECDEKGQLGVLCHACGHARDLPNGEVLLSEEAPQVSLFDALPEPDAPNGEVLLSEERPQPTLFDGPTEPESPKGEVLLSEKFSASSVISGKFFQDFTEPITAQQAMSSLPFPNGELLHSAQIQAAIARLDDLYQQSQDPEHQAFCFELMESLEDAYLAGDVATLERAGPVQKAA